MINELKSRLTSTDAWKASFHFAVLSGLRLFFNLIIGKFAALSLGATGLFYIGQFQSLVLFGQNISTGATHNGIIAIWAGRNPKTENPVPAFLGISLIFSLVFGLLLCLFSTSISELLFRNTDYRHSVMILGAGLIFTGFTQVFISILNGEKAFKQVSVANNLLSLFTMASIITGIRVNGLEGALYGLALAQIPAALSIMALLRKNVAQTFIPLRFQFDCHMMPRLLPYSLMATASVLSVVFVQSAVREEISKSISGEAAGLWEGASRFGNLYTFFIAFLFSGYFLPRLSGKDVKLAVEIKKGVLYFSGLFLIIFILYLPVKGFIFSLIFSKEFSILENLVPFVILGDFFKSCSWMFTNALVARGKTISFIIFELISQAILWGACHFSIPVLGFEGIFQTYAIAWALSLLLLFLYFIPILLSPEPNA